MYLLWRLCCAEWTVDRVVALPTNVKAQQGSAERATGK